MSDGFEYRFPAIRGIQAQREYYVSMCPMRLLPKLFQFDEDELAPELRAQRQLNRARIPELSRYITENVDNYVFSAITVSIDADIAFKSVAGEGEENRIGILEIPMSARFIINDGQHRRAAIDAALRNNPELGDETIAVVFFIDDDKTEAGKWQEKGRTGADDDPRAAFGDGKPGRPPRPAGATGGGGAKRVLVSLGAALPGTPGGNAPGNSQAPALLSPL